MNTTTQLSATKSTLATHNVVLWGLLLAMLVGALAVLVALPLLSEALATTVKGTESKTFWFLSRASGVTSYVLFWASMMMGLLMSTKTTRLWSNGPTFLAMHEFTSILGLVFASFHALILLGDGYINTHLLNVLLPFMMKFTSAANQAIWVGLGQLAFWLFLAILLSYYVRQRIGYATWRWLHFATFVTYMLVSVHGMLAGSDTKTPFMLSVYAFSYASIVFMSIYRVLLMKAASV